MAEEINARELFTDAEDYPEASQFVALSMNENGVAEIELRRPERLNAASPELIWGLAHALYEAKEADARVIVVRGSGRAFCAGHDLKSHPLAEESAAARAHLDRLQYVTRVLRDRDLVSIAEVHGFAYGAGAELALSCDFIVADEATLFSFPEVSVGLSVTGGISFFLPQAIGIPRAKELLMLGAPFDAAEALSLGLINRVTSGDELAAACQELASQFLRLPRHALALSKGTIEAVFRDHAQRAMQYEIENGLETGATDDAEAARARFSERRASGA